MTGLGSDDSPSESEQLLRLVAEAMSHVAKEQLVLAHLERRFESKPANITGSDEEIQALEKRTSQLSQDLGGPPILMPVVSNRERPSFDTFAASAISEVILMFHRARSSICRTHMHFIAGEMIEREPQLLTWPEDDAVASLVRRLAVSGFWEHAETSYIKLASFWDRLGQLLDFIFFNVRQYERDGFPSVMDRIAGNYQPVATEIGDSLNWRRLRSYQTSEQPDGLKWLLRRRNLLVHSLHLAPTQPASQEDNPIFESAYNHLDESIRSKLAPGSREEELRRLHAHLAKAATLINDALSLGELGARLRSKKGG